MTDAIPVAKLDLDRRRVFGWANIAMTAEQQMVVDSHNDTIPPEELEDAAYDFVLEFRETGTNHVGVTKGRMIESFVVTPEKLEKMGLPSNSLPQGWWVGFVIDDDETWELVKSGEYRMFSIQGTGIREQET